MPSGTGLDLFGKAFPTRTFDVGIAEQHAVTFAAGLATEGYKPFCAIYSTFLQRAYDQVVHDVAIQNLPVRFAIDRAGLVGADGADPCRLLRRRLSRLPAEHGGHGGGRRGRARPHGGDRRSPTTTARSRCAIRAAKASASTCRSVGVPLEIGKGRILREGTQIAHPVARHAPRRSARRRPRTWPRMGLSTTVADARFAKPLDRDLIRRLAAEPRGADHHRGRLGRRLRLASCCTLLADDGPARRAA